MEYVPYLEVNENTSSFRLANILLGIGAYIDSAFIEMARSKMFEDLEACKKILKRAEMKAGIIVTAVSAFDQIYAIMSKQVIFKCLPERILITPFKETKPEWWEFYNDVKHLITPSFSKASLKNVRNALAGARYVIALKEVTKFSDAALFSSIFYPLLYVNKKILIWHTKK